MLKYCYKNFQKQNFSRLITPYRRYARPAKLRSTRVNEKGQGSTERVKLCRDRFLNSPLIVDVEYITNYKIAHEKFANAPHPFIRRAESHAYALENLTPIIKEGELIVGNKTRFVRGAIPYCNFASKFVVRELKKMKQEEQHEVHEVGTGGGIAIGHELLKTGKYEKFGGKFLLPIEDKDKLMEAALYFEDKCMQAAGDDLWKNYFDQAEYIEKGWRSVLYTAPHDVAPDGRLVLDYETGLRKGFRKMINEIKEKIKNAEVNVYENTEKLYFWRSCIRVLEAAINFANRYADEAARLAQVEQNPQRKKELLEIERICRKVPEHPPSNFREAIQAFWFMYLCGHIESSYLGYSPGRFDRYMYPYFEMDKTLDPDDALELLELLRVKMQELQYVASFSWEGLGSGNLFQNMILGGETRNGESAENDLSMLCLQAAINCRTTEPTLSIWYSNTLSNEFLLKAAEIVKTGVGFPAWFNLKVYLQHELQSTGLPLSEIREYAAMGGCTEPTMEGMSYGVVQPGFINHGKLLELALNGGKDPISGEQFDKTPIPQTYEELYDAYLFHLRESMRNWQRYWNYVMAAHRLTVNNFYAASLTRDCIERGLSLDDGGARVNTTPTTLSSGLVNVVNSLAAVKKLVKDEKVCTMDELREALAKNWEGYENLHRLALDAPKWGNNDDYVDSIYVDLFAKYCEYAGKEMNYLGKPYEPSMLAISTHVPFGKATGATPDGRKRGNQLADGVTSPMPSTDKNGIFAVLQSSAKIDHTKIRGGLLNLKIHPTALKGIEGSQKLLSLIKTYFDSNGFQVQFNVVDSKVLRDAKLHPENYRDLIVRVAGFSAAFVELSPNLQDEVIARTEHWVGSPQGHHEEYTNTKTHIGEKAMIFDIQDFTIQDGPGVRSTIFLKGCPLRCDWCCNPESQRPYPQYMFNKDRCQRCQRCKEIGATFPTKDSYPVLPSKVIDSDFKCPNEAIRVVGKTWTADELFDMMKSKLKFYQESGGGITLSGGEPLFHANFVHEFISLVKTHGVNIGIETSGFWDYENDTIKDIIANCNFIYFDIKAFDEKTHEQFTGVKNGLILKNLKAISESYADKIIISVPVVPGVNTSNEEFTNICKFVSECGIKKMRLLPLHTMGLYKYRQLGIKSKIAEDAKVSGALLSRMKEIATNHNLECTIE